MKIRHSGGTAKLMKSIAARPFWTTFGTGRVCKEWRKEGLKLREGKDKNSRPWKFLFLFTQGVVRWDVEKNK